MIKNKTLALLLSVALVMGLATFYSCKQCKKEESKPVPTDTTVTTTPVKVIDLPNADSTLIPIVSEVLQNAFAASTKKDMAKLATYLIYTGIDTLRYGKDTYKINKKEDKELVMLTSQGFNRWTANTTSIDYSRCLQQPLFTGDTMVIMEVFFNREKEFNRKFFGFLKLGNDYKIVTVSSTI